MNKQALKSLVLLTLLICLTLALPGLSAAADNLGEYTQGQPIGTVAIFTSGLPIEGCELSSGGLPRGVQMTWDTNAVYLTGTPETTGNYSAVYLVTTSEGMMDAPVTFTVLEAPYVAPTEAPQQQPAGNTALPNITKHPGGESYILGDERDVKFIARAENYTKFSWRLVSPDASNTIQATQAPDYFRGLEVSGANTDTLILRHLTKDMDGWYVDVKFENDNGFVLTSGAKIVILDTDGNPVAAAPAPQPTQAPAATTAPSSSEGTSGMPVDENAKSANISVQPESIEVMPGDTHTFSVIATSPNNGSLSYQWYSAGTDNVNAAVAISGATGASYTVEKAEETTFYWVSVWNVKEGKRSQPVFSDAAELRVYVEPTPTPMPTPSPEPTAEPGGASNINFQLVMFSAIGLLALAALIGVVLYLRADSGKEK